MKEYTFSDLQIGLKEEFDFHITNEQQKYFCLAGEDVNPLHTDESYAKKQGYAGRVVYGMLQGAIYSQLVGVYLPGRYCLLQDIKLSFMDPVYIGETLHVIGEIVEKDERYRRVAIKAAMRNQKGKKVSRALIHVGLMA